MNDALWFLPEGAEISLGRLRRALPQTYYETWTAVFWKLGPGAEVREDGTHVGGMTIDQARNLTVLEYLREGDLGAFEFYLSNGCAFLHGDVWRYLWRAAVPDQWSSDDVPFSLHTKRRSKEPGRHSKPSIAVEPTDDMILSHLQECSLGLISTTVWQYGFSPSKAVREYLAKMCRPDSYPVDQVPSELEMRSRRRKQDGGAAKGQIADSADRRLEGYLIELKDRYLKERKVSRDERAEKLVEFSAKWHALGKVHRRRLHAYAGREEQPTKKESVLNLMDGKHAKYRPR